MPELVGMEKLKTKLSWKQSGVEKRYRYYDMHIAAKLLNRDLPREFTWIKCVLGWCGKAVDSLADRIVFRDFAEDNFDMMSIFQMNSMDVLCDSAILAALIGSCSFIYIAPDVDGFPRMRALDAYNATGTIDPITHMLTEGYAVLERDSNNDPILEAYFVPGRTDYFPAEGEPYSVMNAAPYPLLVPVINRPDATRAFGHSRITRACMDLMQAAMRTLNRSDIASEFFFSLRNAVISPFLTFLYRLYSFAPRSLSH